MISFDQSHSNMTAEEKTRSQHRQRGSIYLAENDAILNHVQIEGRRAKDIITDAGLNRNYHQYHYRYR